MSVITETPMYIINTFFGTAEEDVFADGCLPETGFDIKEYSVSISGSDIDELICNVCKEFEVDVDALEFNACETPGRLDIARMEAHDGWVATETELALWKAGEIKLWYVVYTGYLHRDEYVAFPDHYSD